MITLHVASFPTLFLCQTPKGAPDDRRENVSRLCINVIIFILKIIIGQLIAERSGVSFEPQSTPNPAT